jgi:hypothetical protein
VRTDYTIAIQWTIPIQTWVRVPVGSNQGLLKLVFVASQVITHHKIVIAETDWSQSR